MRINKPRRPQKWLPTVMAMPRMLKELESAPPEVGFLGYASVGRMTAQLRSSGGLRARPRQAALARLNSRGDVGIWHETYLVRAGQCEAIYSGMPLTGLAKAGARAAVTAETESARQRLRVDAS